jgi:hypothetical protein
VEKENPMSDSTQLPPAAVTINYRVADFDAWKTVFDANRQGRIDHGFVGHHINRGEADPNDISVYLAAGDVATAQAYTVSDELKALMQQAGVLSPPQRTWLKPLRQSIVWDRHLPAVIVSHTVADLDQWLAGYDGADALRQSGGIIGHAANQTTDDPARVVVYHQAESFDTLRSFLASEQLGAAMQAAGATSAPEASFYTGGYGERY